VLAEVKLPTSLVGFYQSHLFSYYYSQILEYRWSLDKVAEQLNLPSFPIMVRQFLYDQLYPDSDIPSSQLEVTAYPEFGGRISIFYSAISIFRAPSDFSNVNNLRREYIRATPSWRNGAARYDCVF
jgi:hypothetical protein